MNAKTKAGKAKLNASRNAKPSTGLISRPTIKTMLDQRSPVVHRRELVYAGSSGVVAPVRIMSFQPGTMDWIGPMASRYEYYELLSAKILYESWAGSTTGGIVALSVDYDVHDASPTTFNDMANGFQTVSTAAWKSFSFPIQTRNVNPRKLYTCGGGYPQGADKKFYDAFNLFAYGSTSFPGTVWIEYTLRFSSPQIAFALSGSVDSPASPTVLSSGTIQVAKDLLYGATGNAPVEIVEPSGADVAAGMFAGAKAIKLAPFAERFISNCFSTSTADHAADIIAVINGGTATRIGPINTASTAAGTDHTSGWAIVAGAAGAVVQFALDSASSLSYMKNDVFTATKSGL